MKGAVMHLTVFLPSDSLLEEDVVKVRGEGRHGQFCLKPRHIDYVAALRPGIFSYVTAAGREHFLALDQGIVVKQGDQVKIAARRAVAGELGQLFREVEKMLVESDEREKQNQSAVARLEVGFLKRFLEFSHRA